MNDKPQETFFKKFLKSLEELGKKQQILFRSEKGLGREAADATFVENLHEAFGVESFDLGEVSWHPKKKVQHEQHGGCRQYQQAVIRFESYPLLVGVRVFPQMEEDGQFQWLYQMEYGIHEKWMEAWTRKFKTALLEFPKEGRLQTEYAPNKCLNDEQWISTLFSSRNEFVSGVKMYGDVDVEVKDVSDVQDAYRMEVVITFNDFGVRVTLDGVYLTKGWSYEIKQMVFDRKTFRTLKDTPFRFKGDMLDQMNEGLAVIESSGTEKAATSSEYHAYTGLLLEVDGKVPFIETDELLRQTLSRAFHSDGDEIQGMLSRTGYTVTGPDKISSTETEWVLTFTEGFNQTLTFRMVEHRGKKNYVLTNHTA